MMDKAGGGGYAGVFLLLLAARVLLGWLLSAHTTAHEAPGSSGQVGQARATLIRGAAFAFELIN